MRPMAAKLLDVRYEGITDPDWRLIGICIDFNQHADEYSNVIHSAPAFSKAPDVFEVR